MTKLRVHLLNEHAIAPEYAHSDDSGCDLFSVEELIIEPGEYGRVKTGISVEIPEGYEVQIRSKSGLAARHGLFVLNAPATIDEGYRGELEVILANFGANEYAVFRGQKIGQLVLCPVAHAEIVVMDDTQRGVGGFGSTGVFSIGAPKLVEEEKVVELKPRTQPHPPNTVISSGNSNANYTMEVG